MVKGMVPAKSSSWRGQVFADTEGARRLASAAALVFLFAEVQKYLRNSEKLDKMALMRL